jgi:hypothetical protein
MAGGQGINQNNGQGWLVAHICLPLANVGLFVPSSTHLCYTAESKSGGSRDVVLGVGPSTSLRAGYARARLSPFNRVRGAAFFAGAYRNQRTPHPRLDRSCAVMRALTRTPNNTPRLRRSMPHIPSVVCDTRSLQNGDVFVGE